MPQSLQIPKRDR